MDPQSGRGSAARHGALLTAFAAGTAGMAVLALGWTAAFWFRHHPHLPWQDLYVIWTNVLPVLDTGAFDQHALAMLLEPHYAAHRILLPRLLVVLDVLAFHGQGHALYAAGWAGAFSLWAMFAVTAARLSGAGRAGALFGAALAGILLFAPPGAWNLANPINCSWHLALALALGAFALAIPARQGHAALPWAGAYALATLAALTNFAGVVAWLLLPLIALPQGWRAVVVAGVASGVLSALYLQGISSDAAVAMRWEQGDPQAAAALRNLASEALARNDLRAVATRTLRFLGWPLAANLPVPAASLVTGSLLLVLAGAASWVRGWRQRADRAPWLMFPVLAAGLCLGVAIATQLGRVIEQPNYAHGPSFERYQTVVSVYWSACAMLALAFARHLRPRAGALAWGASLAVALVVAAPGSDCLKQEVESAEYASRLFLLGEHPEWREPQDRALLRFRPEFVFTFDEVMARRELAYHAPPPRWPRSARSARCEAIGLRLSAVVDAHAGPARLAAEWNSWRSVAVRGLVLYAGADPVGRLYARHVGRYTPADLVAPARTRWEGMADAGVALQGPVDVGVETPVGLRVLCSTGMAIAGPGG